TAPGVFHPCSPLVEKRCRFLAANKRGRCGAPCGMSSAPTSVRQHPNLARYKEKRMPTTLIKDADWVIAWQAHPGRHVYLRGVDLAFEGATITHVGKAFSGSADKIVDGRKRMLMPGLINLHSHPEHEPAYRGVREEHGLANMYMSGLFERSQAFYATDDQFRAASAEFAYCELLRSGVTTLIDISPAWTGWVELLAKSGLRAFLAPGYASARWRLENDFELKYTWDEQAGRQR